MSLAQEIKRKAFHLLGMAYLGLYGYAGRTATLVVLAALIPIAGAVEALRLRRPEVNAAILRRLGGIHREEEIFAISGVFWMLAGVWLTMFIFTNPVMVYAAVGFVIFGDSAAALAGRRWGRRPLPWNPSKSWAGWIAFAVAAGVWAVLVGVPWPVALLAAAAAAGVESHPFKASDNLILPLAAGAFLSVFNLAAGR